MKVAVIGAGSWGTALAQVLAGNGHQVVLWARKNEVARAINERHENPRYLSTVVLHSNISATDSMKEALQGAQAALVVTPSAHLREVADQMACYCDEDLPIAICSKGVEAKTGMLPIQVMASVMGGEERFACLAGPNHAEEVIEGQPSATVIASHHEATAQTLQELIATRTFRTYVSNDPIGVELCAAFKNVIAIAVGVSYGAGFGDNTAALLITRGLAEMSPMVVACGGEALTCMGLAGVGDMVVTCMSRHSRNRRFGEDYVAHGRTLADFERENHMVVEGAIACKTLQTLSESHGVELPLTDTVRAVVWDGADFRKAAAALIERPLKTEFYGLS